MAEIEIRTYKDHDVTGFFEAVTESIQEIGVWLPWCHDGYSIKETELWVNQTVPRIWDSKKGCEFIIVNPKSQKVLGGCCLEQLNLDKKEASIGYWIRTSETGKGIATRACFFLIKYGIEELGLNLIKVIPSAENIPSQRVADKLPYQEIKKVKDGFEIRGKVSDALVYKITKASYTNSINEA